MNLATAASSLVLSSLAADPTVGTQGDTDEGDADETVVVAHKLEEPLFTYPQSATVFDERALDDAGIRTLQEASLTVPNLRLTEFSSRRLSFPFIRGIGSGVGDPAVVTYIDDVPQFGTGGTNLPLVDVESVEILRGPQGTLYGRNALGGLIHVTSTRPTEEARSGGDVTFGSFDLQEYHAGAAGALGSGLFGGAGLLYSKRDGYTKNDFTGNDVDDRDGLFGRGQLVFAADEDSELRLGLFGERSRDGGFVLSDIPGLRDRPHRINQDFEGEAERDVYAPSLVWEHAGDELDFTSISAYETWDVLETSDFDFSPADFVRRRTDEEQDYLYQELRIGSARDVPYKVGDHSELGWIAGVSGFLADSELSNANEFRPGSPFTPGIDRQQGDFDDWGAAVFGQATLTLDERLDLTGGLRYDYESKEVDRVRTFDGGGGPVVIDQGSEDESFDEILPFLSAGYRFLPELFAYLSAARGFKPGGFNLGAPAGQIEFDPESNWTYELGARATFCEERYRVGGALFFVDWEDQQLSLFDPVGGTGFVDNAGESESKGVELEGAARVVEGLDAFATFGLLDTEIEEFTDQFGIDTSGNDLPFAPETTWSAGLQYGRALSDDSRWIVRGEYGATGDFFYDPGNREGDDFSLANFRAGVEGERWGFHVWLRNAFDEEYIPIALQVNPADPTFFVGESGAPRTVGVTLSVNI